MNGSEPAGAPRNETLRRWAEYLTALRRAAAACERLVEAPADPALDADLREGLRTAHPGALARLREEVEREAPPEVWGASDAAGRPAQEEAPPGRTS